MLCETFPLTSSVRQSERDAERGDGVAALALPEALARHDERHEPEPVVRGQRIARAALRQCHEAAAGVDERLQAAAARDEHVEFGLPQPAPVIAGDGKDVVVVEVDGGQRGAMRPVRVRDVDREAGGSETLTRVVVRLAGIDEAGGEEDSRRHDARPHVADRPSQDVAGSFGIGAVSGMRVGVVTGEEDATGVVGAPGRAGAGLDRDDHARGRDSAPPVRDVVLERVPADEPGRWGVRDPIAVEPYGPSRLGELADAGHV